MVKYHPIFARHRFDIGGNDEFKVKLTPTHNDPVYKKSPPTALHIKDDLKVELALLQYYGILCTLPYSKYSSPIFAQRKPSGKMRILVDLRRINHVLRHDYDNNNFPIPSMDEANAHMANKIYFSKLDCSQAYHVVKMADERSIQLLAFNFESRTFAYQRLAQGLNRSATAFSSFMRKYLEKDIAADRCAAFMDDVCTATRTFQQHVEALDHVFASLKRSGLRLTIKKCEFGVPSIDYLGWTISKTGQGVQKDKIEKQLAKMTMPRSPHQIQKLIGFMNYFKNYIPNLAEKLLPFYKMLQKGAKQTITPHHKAMLKALKEDLKMTMERTMRLPLADRQYVIMADASDFAAGYVLLIEDYTKDQKGNSKKLYAPVAFGSKKFSQAQYKHTIHTKEFLAIYYAFETFAYMIWGITNKPVVVFTDNKALSSFLQCPTIPAALCKYVDRLLQFRFVLAHVAGEDNPVADYLSRMYTNPHLLIQLEIGARLPVHDVQIKLKPNIATEEVIPNADGSPPTPTPPPSPKPPHEDDDLELPLMEINSLNIWSPINSLQMEDPNNQNCLTLDTIPLKLNQEQDKDPNIRQVKRWILHKRIPDTTYETQEIRKYQAQLPHLTMTPEGVLVRKFWKHNGRDYFTQTVIPKHLRKELLLRLHNTKTESHRGMRKTIEECRRKYYWPNYHMDIRDWISNCLTCMQIKPIPTQHIKPPLQSLSSQTAFPGDMLQVDLVGPFTPAGGYTHIITAIDVFTKYLFATPIRRVTARTVVDALTDIFLKHTYIPITILTDKGTQFTSNLMKEATDLLDIDLKHATVKHPQTIGLLERAHAGLKKTLKIYENNQHKDWHKYINYAVFAHNTAWNPNTKTTPSDLFHGFAPNKPIDIRFQVPEKPKPEFPTIQDIQDKIRHLHGLQKKDLILNFIRYKEYYDQKAKATPLRLHTYCLLLNPRLDNQQQKMNKMQPKWLALYRIEKKMANENYLIRETNTNNTQIVHRMRLRPYNPNHKITDLSDIKKENFQQDPKFPQEYLHPQITDRAHAQLFINPEDLGKETTPKKEPPTKPDPTTITNPAPGAIYTKSSQVQVHRQGVEPLPTTKTEITPQTPRRSIHDLILPRTPPPRTPSTAPPTQYTQAYRKQQQNTNAPYQEPLTLHHPPPIPTPAITLPIGRSILQHNTPLHITTQPAHEKAQTGTSHNTAQPGTSRDNTRATTDNNTTQQGKTKSKNITQRLGRALRISPLQTTTPSRPATPPAGPTTRSRTGTRIKLPKRFEDFLLHSAEQQMDPPTNTSPREYDEEYIQEQIEAQLNSNPEPTFHMTDRIRRVLSRQRRARIAFAQTFPQVPLPPYEPTNWDTNNSMHTRQQQERRHQEPETPEHCKSQNRRKPAEHLRGLERLTNTAAHTQHLQTQPNRQENQPPDTPLETGPPLILSDITTSEQQVSFHFQIPQSTYTPPNTPQIGTPVSPQSIESPQLISPEQETPHDINDIYTIIEEKHPNNTETTNQGKFDNTEIPNSEKPLKSEIPKSRKPPNPEALHTEKPLALKIQNSDTIPNLAIHEPEQPRSQIHTSRQNPMVQTPNPIKYTTTNIPNCEKYQTTQTNTHQNTHTMQQGGVSQHYTPTDPLGGANHQNTHTIQQGGAIAAIPLTQQQITQVVREIIKQIPGTQPGGITNNTRTTQNKKQKQSQTRSKTQNPEDKPQDLWSPIEFPPNRQ